MKPIRLALLATLASCLLPFALKADLLKDNNMQGGIEIWKGDGEVAYLNPDGTEGAEGDKGVTKVIKIQLSKSHARGVRQEFTAPANLVRLTVSVEVMASHDFKRSKFPSDYSSEINWGPGEIEYWWDGVVPKVDFWLRGEPGFQYKMANLKPGQWVTVSAAWDPGFSATDRAIGCFVPAGEGAIYIRKATAK